MKSVHLHTSKCKPGIFVHKNCGFFVVEIYEHIKSDDMLCVHALIPLQFHRVFPRREKRMKPHLGQVHPSAVVLGWIFVSQMHRI